MTTDEYLIERADDTGEAIYVHSDTCGGYCDYACNHAGQKAADQINLTEAEDCKSNDKIHP